MTVISTQPTLRRRPPEVRAGLTRSSSLVSIGSFFLARSLPGVGRTDAGTNGMVGWSVRRPPQGGSGRGRVVPRGDDTGGGAPRSSATGRRPGGVRTPGRALRGEGRDRGRMAAIGWVGDAASTAPAGRDRGRLRSRSAGRSRARRPESGIGVERRPRRGPKASVLVDDQAPDVAALEHVLV